MVLISKHWITFFSTAQDLPMKDKTFFLRKEKIVLNILRKTDTSITPILLHGDQSFSAEFNTKILSSSIDHISSTRRFESIFFTATWFMYKCSKFYFPNLLDLFSLYSFILSLVFVRFLVSFRYTNFYYNCICCLNRNKKSSGALVRKF